VSPARIYLRAAVASLRAYAQRRLAESASTRTLHREFWSRAALLYSFARSAEGDATRHCR
jgi:hypothetical protein